MKKIFLYILLAFSMVVAWLIFKHTDYRRDSRHFYCMDNNCVTLWRTYQGVAYIIPGKYTGLTRPMSQSYITSTFIKGMDLIWQKDTDDIIVCLEDENKQVIHQSSNGIKLINYNSNKKHNDSVFTNFDEHYHRYKKDVKYININIKEEYATTSDGKVWRN